MRTRFLFASLAFATAFAPFAVAPLRAEQAQVQPLAQKIDLAQLVDKVIETIDQRFVDVEMMKRVDWSAKARAARDSVLASATTEEAVRRINALLAELKTSHTALYTPDDPTYYILLDIVGGAGGTAELIAKKFWGVGPWYAGIGAFTAQVGAQHFIDGVMEGSPADKAGLKFGDEIVSVDGASYSPVAAFRGKAGGAVALEIRRTRDAAPFVVSVPVIPIRPSAAFVAATRESARVIEKDGRRIGYIHLWSINESRSFAAALAAIDPTQGEAQAWRRPSSEARAKALDFLIVDARGRVGGNVGSAGEILDILDRGQKPYWGDLHVGGRDGQAQTRNPANFSRVRAFRGRSVLLTNHHTRSAGELVAYGYKRGAFGSILGANTAGAVTSGATIMMPGDLLLYVAVGTLDFEGRRLEGEGVAPDVPIERSLPYANGADPVLDAAIAQGARKTP